MNEKKKLFLFEQMTIVQRKIKMVREINPSLDGVKIIVRKNRVVDGIPIDQRLERIVFGPDERMDGNYDFVRRLVKRRLGYGNVTMRSVPIGHIVKIVSFDPSLAYEFRVMECLYDHEDNFVRTYDVLSNHAIIHADDISEFIRNCNSFDYGDRIDPLDVDVTNIYIHSMTSIPPNDLWELMMTKATIHLVINEWVLDKIIERAWG